MDERRIRLECLKLAVAVVRRKSALRVSEEELAERFAEFCACSEIHLEALSSAVKGTHASTTIEGIIDMAKAYAGFAHRGLEAPTEEAPKAQVRGRGRTRKT